MRRRFFLITTAVLLFTVAAISAIQSTFFRHEQDRWLDRRIEEMASALYSSDLTETEVEDVEEATDIIADALGQDRIDLVVALYNQKGKLLFQNRNLLLMGGPVSTEPRWQTIERGRHLIRVLTLNLPSRKKILQVGMVLDTDLVRWKEINLRVLTYVGAIFVFVVVIAYLLSTVLLRPLSVIAEYLRHLAFSIDRPEAPPLPPALYRLRRLGRGGKDEVAELSEAVSKLVERLREATKNQTTRTAQLAHELKTPLTIIRNCLESLKRTGADAKQVEDAAGEVDRLANLIQDFLDWAVLENSAGNPSQIHALKLSAYAKKEVERLSSLYPDRISFSESGQTMVFALPFHLEQLISNLLSNALKYSPKESTVSVIVSQDGLEVRNSGSGIPPQVLARLGSPFNRGQGEGSGLGLAWVKAICGRYQWKLNVDSSEQGTKISVGF